MMYSVCTCFLVFTFSCWCNAQKADEKTFSKQLSVVTENDRYMMQGKDQYYTNGIMINYSTAKKGKKPSVLKKINSYEIGQRLYTPYSRKIYITSQIDRPVTGYLYAKFTQSNFIKHNQFWQWGASVGTIGKSSLGKSMQYIFHKAIHVNSDWWGWIWDYQLKDEVGANLHGSYAAGLLKGKASSFFQITPVTQATLGTNFTNISQGAMLQFGKINTLHQSAYWNANIQAKQSLENAGTELFFYYYPQVMYQFYNATVQGGMFIKDKGPITASLTPLVVTHRIGAMYAQCRYSLRVEADFQSKEAASQLYNHHAYGSIAAAYRFN